MLPQMASCRAQDRRRTLAPGKSPPRPRSLGQAARTLPARVRLSLKAACLALENPSRSQFRPGLGPSQQRDPWTVRGQRPDPVRVWSRLRRLRRGPDPQNAGVAVPPLPREPSLLQENRSARGPGLFVLSGRSPAPEPGSLRAREASPPTESLPARGWLRPPGAARLPQKARCSERGLKTLPVLESPVLRVRFSATGRLRPQVQERPQRRDRSLGKALLRSREQGLSQRARLSMVLGKPRMFPQPRDPGSSAPTRVSQAKGRARGPGREACPPRPGSSPQALPRWPGLEPQRP